MPSLSEVQRYYEANKERVHRYFLAMEKMILDGDSGVKLFVRDIVETAPVGRLHTAAVLVAMGYGRSVVNDRIHARVAILRLEE